MVYLFYGEEDYWIKQKKENLRKKLLPEDDTMNLTIYNGAAPPVNEIIDIAETMPFFADCRVIIIENSGLFKDANTPLAEYLKTVPESTHIIFVEREVDKRLKMFKTCKSIGTVEEVNNPGEKQLAVWIAQRAAAEGLAISADTCTYMLGKCGLEMNNLFLEMNKLFSYCHGRELITADDIDSICSTHIENKIFKMLDDMAAGNRKEALDKYYDLVSLKEPPMRILFLMARQFRIMLTVVEMADGGADNASIAKTAGIQPFLVRKYKENGKKIGAKRIREAMESCVKYEQAVKTGNLNDQLSVELILIQYSGS